MAYRTPEYRDYFTIDSNSQRDSYLCRAEGGDTQGRLRGRAEKRLEAAWSSDKRDTSFQKARALGQSMGARERMGDGLGECQSPLL